MKRISSSLVRLHTVMDKLAWGLKAVGLKAAVRGAARYAFIWLRRPPRAEVQLRAGPVLEFDYPGQFPATLMVFGDFIDPEFAFLKEVVRPGWRVVDVGAAIGQFSMFAATCFPRAIVHAFEPSSVNVATLQRNIARNRAGGRVVVHQAALSNRKETARFETAQNTWISRLAPAASRDLRTELVRVDTVEATLKSLHLDHAEVLKVNVAGHEPEVLEGAIPALVAGRIDIMILLLGLRSLPHYAAIAELGYRFFYYHPLEHTLFELVRFDEDAVLKHRPWPARHIIVIRAEIVAKLVAGRIAVKPLIQANAVAKNRRRQTEQPAAGGS